MPLLDLCDFRSELSGEMCSLLVGKGGKSWSEVPLLVSSQQTLIIEW